METRQREPLPVSHAPITGGNGTDEQGHVRIARTVLRTVVHESALSVDGVARLANAAGAWAPILGRPRPHDGVAMSVHGQAVGVDLYIVVEPGVNMVTVGSAVQERVGAAIEHILGMTVTEINVYIQDVA